MITLVATHRLRELERRARDFAELEQRHKLTSQRFTERVSDMNDLQQENAMLRAKVDRLEAFVDAFRDLMRKVPGRRQSDESTNPGGRG